jgi:hypothetical protein
MLSLGLARDVKLLPYVTLRRASEVEARRGAVDVQDLRKRRDRIARPGEARHPRSVEGDLLLRAAHRLLARTNRMMIRRSNPIAGLPSPSPLASWMELSCRTCPLLSLGGWIMAHRFLGGGG